MYIQDIAIYKKYDKGSVVYKKSDEIYEFHIQTLCITEHLMDLIYRKIMIDGNKRRIILYLFPFESVIWQEDEIDDIVIFLSTNFDFTTYYSSSDFVRKQMIANVLELNLFELFHSKGWDTKSLAEAFLRLKDDNYAFITTPRKIWVSPDKRYSLKFKVYWDLNQVVFEALLYKYRTKTEVLRQEFIKTKPFDACRYYVLSNVKWISNHAFESYIIEDNKKKEYRIEVPNGI